MWNEHFTLNIQQLINGLSLGSIYALIALGYTMVFGVLRFINFAHGDLLMVGAFSGILVITGQSGMLSDSLSVELRALVGVLPLWRKWFLMGVGGLLLLDLLLRMARGKRARLILGHPSLLLPLATAGLVLFLPVLGNASFGPADGAPLDSSAAWLAGVLPWLRWCFPVLPIAVLIVDLTKKREANVLPFLRRPAILVPLLALAAAIYLPWLGVLLGGPSTGALPHMGWAIFVLVTAILVCAGCGISIEQLCYRPLRSRPRITVLITAIGVSLLLESLGQFAFGTQPQAFPQVITVEVASCVQHDVVWGGTQVWSKDLILTTGDIMIMSTTVVLLALLVFIVKFTKIGMAMRALAFNPTACSLMGVNVNFVIGFTFGLGSALAGAAGVMTGLVQNADPLLGVNYGLKAFVAAVVGGIGNLPGAVLGGLLIGVLETFVAGSDSLGTYRDAAAFAVLIVILLVRPAGLLGKNVREKV